MWCLVLYCQRLTLLATVRTTAYYVVTQRRLVFLFFEGKVVGITMLRLGQHVQDANRATDTSLYAVPQ